jgi:Flp pilus assembly protein TadG
MPIYGGPTYGLKTMRTRRFRLQQRRGTYTVEFAVVSSVFFLFLFGILEYSRFVMTLEGMQNAAREGARYAVVHTHDKTASDIQNEVDSRLSSIGLQLQGYSKTSNIQVYMANPVTGNPVDENGNSVGTWTQAPFTSAQFGQAIAVQVSGTYKPILPNFLMLNSSLSLRARYVMNSEAN